MIDATPLVYRQRGIGRLTRMLIESIAAVGTAHEVVLFGRRLQGRSIASAAPWFPARRLRLPRAAEPWIERFRIADMICRGDLYHATDFYLPVVAVERCIATIHDVIFLTQSEGTVDHRRLAERVPAFAKRCRRIIAVSEHTKREIVKHLDVAAEKVDVVHSGVDGRLFRPSAEGTLLEDGHRPLGLPRPYFLAVSCSTGRKNTPMLLEAYAELAGQAPANDLVLVWAPPAELRARYDAGSLGQRIHFVGPQDDGTLADLYRGATALVYPSLHEGFGLPVLEAMSCGTPVIASNSSSIPEVGGSAAVYVDPKDRASLVAAMASFENDGGLRASLVGPSREQASRFTWRRCALETLAVYDRSLAELG